MHPSGLFKMTVSLSQGQALPMDVTPHILVVDDDKDIRELLSRFLKKNGYRVGSFRCLNCGGRCWQCCYRSCCLGPGYSTAQPSPTLSLARIVATGKLEIERQFLQNILGLMTLPKRKEIAQAKFQQSKVRAVEAILKTAAEARRA